MRMFQTETIKLTITDQHFRKILDSLLLGIQVIDFDWRYVYVNNALKAQRRNKNKTLVGRTMKECYLVLRIPHSSRLSRNVW